MDTPTPEQDLRRAAVRRRLPGQPARAICQDLGRRRRWLRQGWREFQRHPDTDFADHSRAPLRSAPRLPEEVAQASVTTRRALEGDATPETRYGLMDAAAIRGQLQRLHLQPLPSVATIQRVLVRAGRTHPVGAARDAASSPWPVPGEIKAMQATDSSTQHLRGGGVIHNFPPLDRARHAVCLTEHADKSGPVPGPTCSGPGPSWAGRSCSRSITSAAAGVGRPARGSSARWCACACSARSSRSSSRATRPSAITRSRPSTAFGSRPSGRVTSSPAWPRCRPRSRSSGAGSARRISRPPGAAGRRPRGGGASCPCVGPGTCPPGCRGAACP